MEPPKQGSPEWHQQRLGKATASRFSDMMTNGRGKDAGMGQTAWSYMDDLLVERLTGQPQDIGKFKETEWGNKHEAAARAIYSLQHSERVKQTGFLDHPTIPMVGGSPDGLIGDDGGVEIKCPYNPRYHLDRLLHGGMDPRYQWQVQGLMWITGRKWWDFVSFDPRFPEDKQLFVCRVEADPDALDDLERRVLRFMEQLEIKFRKIMEGNGADKTAAGVP